MDKKLRIPRHLFEAKLCGREFLKWHVRKGEFYGEDSGKTKDGSTRFRGAHQHVCHDVCAAALVGIFTLQRNVFGKSSQCHDPDHLRSVRLFRWIFLRETGRKQEISVGTSDGRAVLWNTFICRISDERRIFRRSDTYSDDNADLHLFIGCRRYGELKHRKNAKIRLKYHRSCDIIPTRYVGKEPIFMKHVQTLNTRKLQNTVKKGGCGECQTSCQSACKTSCTVGNQTCEQCK